MTTFLIRTIEAPERLSSPSVKMRLEEWHEKLFGCFRDMPICCVGMWCPCVLYGRNQQRIGDGSCGFGYECCGYFCCLLVPLLLCCGSPPLCCLIAAPKRQYFRLRYGLRKEEDCDDWHLTFFCGCCAMCQEAREMKYRGPPPPLSKNAQPLAEVMSAVTSDGPPVIYASTAQPQRYSPLQRQQPEERLQKYSNQSTFVPYGRSSQLDTLQSMEMQSGYLSQPSQAPVDPVSM